MPPSRGLASPLQRLLDRLEKRDAAELDAIRLEIKKLGVDKTARLILGLRRQIIGASRWKDKQGWRAPPSDAISEGEQPGMPAGTETGVGEKGERR
jgi:hypothetical protein